MTREQDAPTPYDEVAYPTAIFNQTQPDRLATLARLTGLNPPPIETARVLEIGAGDGMNLLALAVVYPRATFVGFDLAATAVARGQAWIAQTGVTNLTLRTLDILDAADALEGEFDYIIAHGVYAWVPPEVRAATMALIGRKLSPDGVGFVSYNAMPGGHIRLAMREALLFALEGVPDEDREEIARAHLRALAEAPEGPENPSQTAFRDAARQTVDKVWQVLCHDELGPCFYPQSVVDVARAAAANGLRWLGDADRERMTDAFLSDEVPAEPDVERQVLRMVQARDYRSFCYFRQSLLVRDDKLPSRYFDHKAMDELYATTRCVREAPATYRLDTNAFEMVNDTLIAAMERLIAVGPGRVRVGDIADSDPVRTALFQLFDAGVIDLHTIPAPFATHASERPVASPLIRMMIGQDMKVLCRLDHRLMSIVDDGARKVLALLDGSRDRAALLAIGAESGLGTPELLDDALDKLAHECAFVA